MKHVIKMILVISFLVPAALFAKSPEDAYVESFAGRTDVPVPISVVKPMVDPSYDGARVWLSFLVDHDGVPREIAAPVDADYKLVKQLAAAVSQWRFKPLMRDGVVVRARVTLPFNVAAPSADAAVAQR